MAYPTAGSVQGRAVLRYYQTWPGGCGPLSDHVTQYEPSISHMHPHCTWTKWVYTHSHYCGKHSLFVIGGSGCVWNGKLHTVHVGFRRL